MLSDYKKSGLLTKSGLLIAGIATLASAIGVVVTGYQEYFGKHAVVIASSPSNAEIRLDGKPVGQTPVTLELKRGTYTLEASRAGFEKAEHGIYVSGTEHNIVNLQLLPNSLAPSPTTAPQTKVATQNLPSNQDILAEVNKLKSMILANPEEAATVTILQEKLGILGEETKALREDLKDVKEQGRWYLATMIATIVGLLAVIATLFVTKRSRSIG